jgi:hypothetical protein
VDLGYLFVYFLDSKSEGGAEGPIGTYRSIAHLTAFTFTARFGRGAKECGGGKKHPHGKHVAPPPPPREDPRAARPAERPAKRSVRPAPPVKKHPRATPPAKRPAGAKKERQPAVRRPGWR